MSKKVLVVTDEIHIVQVVALKLRNNGFEVVTASDGLTAYELACSEMPDAVISDWQMPGLTGIELIDKLSSNQATSHIPVIILTAKGYSIEQDKSQTVNAYACLSKPFSPRELLDKLNALFVETAV